METIGGLVPTGRRLRGPASELVELDSPKGLKHTAIVFNPEYRDHNGINDALAVVLGFLESPMVTGIVELVEHDRANGAFVYPTGQVWSIAEVVRYFADKGEVAGVRAALELMYEAGRILVDAAETGESQGVYSHGGLTPHRVMLQKNGGVQIIGYALPQVEILAFHEDPTRKPREDSFRYCPPERMVAQPEDLSSDLFALGLIAFELITGKPIYDGLVDDIRQQAARGEGSKRLFRFRDQISPGVRDLLTRTLKPDQRDRWPDGNAFLDAVSRCLSGHEAEGPSLVELLGMVSSQVQRTGKPVNAASTMMGSREDFRAALGGDDGGPSEPVHTAWKPPPRRGVAEPAPNPAPAPGGASSPPTPSPPPSSAADLPGLEGSGNRRPGVRRASPSSAAALAASGSQGPAPTNEAPSRWAAAPQRTNNGPTGATPTPNAPALGSPEVADPDAVMAALRASASRGARSPVRSRTEAEAPAPPSLPVAPPVPVEAPPSAPPPAPNDLLAAIRASASFKRSELGNSASMAQRILGELSESGGRGGAKAPENEAPAPRPGRRLPPRLAAESAENAPPSPVFPGQSSHGQFSNAQPASAPNFPPPSAQAPAPPSFPPPSAQAPAPPSFPPPSAQAPAPPSFPPPAAQAPAPPSFPPPAAQAPAPPSFPPPAAQAPAPPSFPPPAAQAPAPPSFPPPAAQTPAPPSFPPPAAQAPAPPSFPPPAAQAPAPPSFPPPAAQAPAPPSFPPPAAQAPAPPSFPPPAAQAPAPPSFPPPAAQAPAPPSFPPPSTQGAVAPTPPSFQTGRASGLPSNGGGTSAPPPPVFPPPMGNATTNPPAIPNANPSRLGVRGEASGASAVPAPPPITPWSAAPAATPPVGPQGERQGAPAREVRAPETVNSPAISRGAAGPPGLPPLPGGNPATSAGPAGAGPISKFQDPGSDGMDTLSGAGNPGVRAPNVPQGPTPAMGVGLPIAAGPSPDRLAREGRSDPRIRGVDAEGARANTKPEAAKPEMAKPELARPEMAKPEPAKPEPAKPEPAKPEAAKAEAAKPEPPKAETPKPAPPSQEGSANVQGLGRGLPIATGAKPADDESDAFEELDGSTRMLPRAALAEKAAAVRREPARPSTPAVPATSPTRPNPEPSRGSPEAARAEVPTAGPPRTETKVETRLERTPDPLIGAGTGGALSFAIRRGPGGKVTRMRLPSGASAAEAVSWMIGNIVPIKLTAMGNLAGWYRLHGPKGKVPPLSLMGQLDVNQELTLEMVPNESRLRTVEVPEVGARLLMPVGSAVPMASLADHLAGLFDLPAGSRQVEMEGAELNAWSILADLPEGLEGRTIRLVRIEGAEG